MQKEMLRFSGKILGLSEGTESISDASDGPKSIKMQQRVKSAMK